MGHASKGVVVSTPHAPIPAQQNATGRLRVRHAQRPVMSSVVTPDVLKNVPSHVPLVQYQNACLRVRIVRAQCLAPLRVITFHALDDARNFYHAATNARPYVVNLVQRRNSVKHVRLTTSRIYLWTSSWVRHTKRLTWTKILAYFPHVDIF